MIRVNNLLEEAAETENLRHAFWKASKGKRYSVGVLSYQENLDENLDCLQKQMKTGLVETGDYRYFKIFDPKEREICASAFSEQVLHHALMNICHDYFEQAQIFDSYASRKGKGTYAAIDRAKYFTRKYGWYLKLDVRKYFGSIHHDVLKSQLERMFKDYRLLEIFGKIIDSYEAEIHRGLPIGSLCSQYFANHYLSGLDHFIKEKLRVKGYVRYMDDMVLWDSEKSVLKAAFLEVNDFVENKLLCSLKPIELNRSTHGLPFLGYKIYPWQVQLTQRSKQRFIKKINYLYENYHSGEWDEVVCQRRVLPLLAFLSHADTIGFRKNVLTKI
ncbi:MAG: RNA-directed DNA polymerase [Bacteroidia bacterium]|nr:RNA-directed DNA polymerase [Bacteroidia bacterium]